MKINLNVALIKIKKLLLRWYVACSSMNYIQMGGSQEFLLENMHLSLINKCKEDEEQILVQLPKVMWQIIEIKHCYCYF